MAQNRDGPDTTSLRPLSALRSQFESLGKDDAAPPSPVGQKPAWLSAQNTGARPKTAGGESSAVGTGSSTAGAPVVPTTPIAPTARKLKPGPPPPRPSSIMFNTPHPHSPPLVTVDSPRSPQKTFSIDMRSSTSLGSTPVQPLTPQRTSESPKSHSRNISRAATPALEARAAAFLQSADSPVAKDAPQLPAPNFNLKQEPKKEAPSINRAAKPRVPTKPLVLAKKPSNLAAPEAEAHLSDRSISPFSTPPSSEGSSPDGRKGLPIPKQPPQKSTTAAPVTQRPRNDSDASWAQRLRGDSDASFASRARGESDASFVESSSLPDSWTSAPTHPAVAANKDPRANGFTRSPTMPARYRSIQGRQAPSTEDLQEDRPRLPVRPELQTRRHSPPKARSGRASPSKLSNVLATRKSSDGLRRPFAAAEAESVPRIPAIKTAHKSALSQGFGGVAIPSSAPAVQAAPRSMLTQDLQRAKPPSTAPAIPAPRRSMDSRRPPPPPPTATASAITTHDGAGHSRDDQEDIAPYGLNSDQVAGPQDFPDATQANRRAPKFKVRPWQIPTEYDTRLFAICGEYLCTSGYITKAWNIRTGAQLLQLENQKENVKVTSIVFKPSPEIEDEGKRMWLGTNSGDIHEVDIPSERIVKTKTNAHPRREVICMFRYASELWTMDDGGDLYVWRPDHKGMPSLDSQTHNWRVPKNQSYAIATGRQLWIAQGRDIRVYYPSVQSDTDFQVLKSPLNQPSAGEITCGATLDGKQELIYFGHSDGKVSVYNRKNYTCQAVVNVSLYKISSLTGVGDYLWAGYSTGMAYVYDTSTSPWTVKKDWKAHEKPILGIQADPSAMWKMGRLNVVTLGTDQLLRIWDGMLQDDWVESQMHSRDSEFCTFREMTAAVLTWNAGASKPSHLGHSHDDNEFLREFMTYREAPDIFVFGFQELVDLEDKKVTAKSLFKSKKKDPADQEHMSRQYRAWRDHLAKSLDDHMPNSETYTLLHTASMVGLFTCIFVRASIRPRIRHVHTSEVKRGMGGHHGNKGALILRMVMDDSSLCFINCHLAAGQTHTMHRNNDIAEILEANALPPYPLDQSEADHGDVFAGGGDGSMIMDHEICVLNGDLNYRIDTMGRDAVIKQVQQGNLAKLLERDQLLLSRKKNPGFRLRAFQESQITFAPTYKYNVHTDDYDTSEKKRAPAWCDRILYRGLGKVKLEDYQRWDQLRISDHRPVSGRLRLRIKTVDQDKRDVVWEKCGKEFEGVSQRIARAAQLEYLTNILGMSPKEAATALQGTVS
ncbi:putative inositol polyphosphate 5-phosphatase [Fulvia fulva]|uniref:Inositol polyphosphate 5-phosphatase n=1 Tax=Passalora fulva TaxID=5499 RepID=A0A9Q8UQZ7_PASFU|nr:putative inositol polyphosphate 5-phosphatase [Fulvia fulva]KAK4623357.1 putative inositol polyphosphate 5-phosphatase [Fulvia fulva]UJO19197.1 putative inositol polyphosphate 5-phosphatase [Fulvia fulva]WPV31302.1 putative inositol polyphosphate 5-phosphatase [Fulvia fulva]